MTHNFLDVLGSVLSFLGGLVLFLDTLRMKSRIRNQETMSLLLVALKKEGGEGALKDDQGNPIKSDTDLQVWFAGNSLKWGWLGFALMTAGFLLDLLAKY